MKIKHWIVVRFLSETLGKFTLSDILSDEMFEMGLKLFKENLLPSLNNQSCTQFELILLIHNQLDDRSKWITCLKSLQQICNFKLNVIYANQLNNIITVNNENKRIISRVDYDDLILDSTVEDIQYFAKQYQRKTLSIYGYNYGYAWRDDTYQLYEIDKNYKTFSGHFSAMQSVILNCVTPINYFYNIHPYLWDHSSVLKFINSIPNDSVKKEIELRYNLNLRAYVWMRHKNTGSVDPYKLKADRVQLINNNHIINALDFETRFGKKLIINFNNC